MKQAMEEKPKGVRGRICKRNMIRQVKEEDSQPKA
jgi:hypothetical protein